MLRPDDEFYVKITASDLNLYRSSKKVSCPWYANHKFTCAFLNKISGRYADKNELRNALNVITEKLWSKNESYSKGVMR